MTTVVRMTKSDLTEEQVATIAAQVEARLDLSRLATPADVLIRTIESEVRLKAEIKQTKVSILRWALGIVAAQLVLQLAILKLFPGGHP